MDRPPVRPPAAHTRGRQLVELGLDLCVLAAPTADHERIGLLLAEAGIHTLIEKPLAEDMQPASRLAEAFESRGLVGAVGHIERYNPALPQIRRRLEAGELGDVYQLATRSIGAFPRRMRDVGIIKDLATHDVDLTARVAGHRFISVSAPITSQVATTRTSSQPTAPLEDGTVGNHLVYWLSPMKERVTVVTGDRGAFAIDPER